MTGNIHLANCLIEVNAWKLISILYLKIYVSTLYTGTFNGDIMKEIDRPPEKQRPQPRSNADITLIDSFTHTQKRALPSSRIPSPK